MKVWLFLSFAILIALPSNAQANSARSQSDVTNLAWVDLLPPGEAERIAQLQQMQAMQIGFSHFGTDRMPQIQTFNVVDELDGQRVRIGGYVLPFDFGASNEISRFLLVPFIGACIHVPPPPPNQLIYVSTDEPVQITGIWDPVFAEGIMRTDRQDNALGDAAYTLELISLSPYRR